MFTKLINNVECSVNFEWPPVWLAALQRNAALAIDPDGGLAGRAEFGSSGQARTGYGEKNYASLTLVAAVCWEHSFHRPSQAPADRLPPRGMSPPVDHCVSLQSRSAGA